MDEVKTAPNSSGNGNCSKLLSLLWWMLGLMAAWHAMKG